MENIDETIRKREEVKELQEKQKEALKELDGILNNISSKNEELQKIQNDKGLVLENISKEAEDRVHSVIDKLLKTNDEMAEIGDKTSKVLVSTENTIKTAVEGVMGLLEGIDELVRSAEVTKNRSEDSLKRISEIEESLKNKIISNSKLEKQLKKREKEVEIRDKDADQKLLQAKQLADWHKTPGAKYTI